MCTPVLSSWQHEGINESLPGDWRIPLGRAELAEDDYLLGIRPHELDISRTADGGNCLLARVVHVNPAGSIVKVRLMAEDFGLMITVDISPDRYRTLALLPGEDVFVTPKAAKFFEPDYNI